MNRFSVPRSPAFSRVAVAAAALAAAQASCKKADGGKTMIVDPTAPSDQSQGAASAAPSGTYVPPAPQDLVFPDEEFRKTQPPAAAERPFQLPPINTFALKNGVSVYLIEQHNLPLISIDLEFDGGALAEPAGKRGLAGICMQALTEGTKTRDALAFSEAAADIAAQINGYAGRETMGLSLDVLSTRFDQALELFADALLAPAFAPGDVGRLVTRAQEGIKQSKGAPSRIATRIAASLVMGMDNPLASFSTEASVGSVTPADCAAFHNTWLHPKKARLFIVGDLTEAQVRAAFDGPRLAGFVGAAPKLPVPKAGRAMAGKIFFVNVPGAAQSQIVVAHAGPKRQAGDYAATNIAAGIFGGSFSSRLNMNIREDKGYAYGARGGIMYFKNAGLFSAGASVRADASYQSLVEVMNELVGFASGSAPLKPEELSRELSSEIYGFPGNFETGRAALGMYSQLIYFGLPLDTYKTYTKTLSKLTAAAVAKAAKAHLKPSQATILVVGDGGAAMKQRVDGKDVAWEQDGKPVTLRAALELAAKNGTFGKGAFVELDADGKPIK